MTSFFSAIQVAPPIEVFNVSKNCLDDPNPDKINLSVGAYRDGNGKPWVLPVVREAERRLALDESQNHEYLPVLGFELFCQESIKLLLGENSAAIKEGRVTGVQCLSGTGSLRIGADFLHQLCGRDVYYLSQPSWENHKLLFRQAGYKEAKEFRYWHQVERKIDFAGLIADLEAAPEHAVVLLHACAHNPTGMDPSETQWQQICEVMKRRRLFPFFDIAYQGFASGNPDKDAWAVRYFVDQKMELIVAQSFAKNFGLYNERIGNLAIVVNDPSVLPAIKSQVSLIVRANWSNPPNHGAKVVHMVLSNPQLKAQWFLHIKEMADRVILVRKLLRDKLEELKTPGNWSHITTQIGMFSYTGLNEKQVELLVKKHHCYLLRSGRISMCGVNAANVAHLANAIDDAVRTVTSGL